MTASRRQALFRLRENRQRSEPEARPTFLAPPGPRPGPKLALGEAERQGGAKHRGGAKQLSLRPMALDKVAESAILRCEEKGGSRRDQCEAAFRALLEREPYLPVANAQRIIDDALARQGGKRSRLANQPAGAKRWVLFSTILALLAAVAAFPFAIAIWSSWWSPGPLQSLEPLSIALALTLPTALLIFPALAWRCLFRQHPVLAVTLASLPLLHIAGTAASFAFP